MGSSRMHHALIASAIVVLAASSIAQAEPNEASKAAARNFMTEGRARRERKDIKGALESFRSADAIMHVPTTAIEVARAQIDLGNLLEARETLESLLSKDPPGSEPPQFTVARASVATLNEDLAKRIPTVHIVLSGAPQDVQVTVSADGEIVPPTAYEPGLNFNPGVHTFTAQAGSTETKQVVNLAEGQTKNLVLDLTEQPLAPQEAQGLLPPSPPHTTPIAVPILAVTAATAFVTAGVFTMLERQKVADLKERCAPTCSDGDIDEARNLLHIIDASLVVGAASAATALVWYLADPPSRPSSSARLASAPLAGTVIRGGALFELRASF